MDESGRRFVDAPFDAAPAAWRVPTTADADPPARSPSPRTRLARWWPLAAAGVVLAAAVGVLLEVGERAGPLLPRDASVEVLYLAEEGELVETAFVRDGVDATDQALHDELWAEWSAMVPPYWTRRVARFEIASDGPGGVAAAVQRLDAAGDRWLLSVDPVDAVERRDAYVHTLVHELAHIVTLGAGRVEVDAQPAATLVEQAERCDGPPVMEGCAAAGTVLAAFSTAFWDLDEVGGPDGVATVGEREDAIVARYLAAPDRYVSAYAASGPTEDIAETFTALALDLPQPRGSVAAAKIDLLRADAELFSLADRIRATLRER